jgi:maltose O-acetyltransferase
MAAGDLYQAWDPEVLALYDRAQRLVRELNAAPIEDRAARRAIAQRLFGSLGEDATVLSPVRCDYGRNVHIGARSFVNFGAVFLDTREIRIGEEVLLGPNVQLLAAEHPLAAAPRRAGWESGRPIAIGDGAWLGGGAIVLPGVTIGANAVIGAGSVVTRDVPPAVVAVGNPARVIRTLPDGAVP